MKSRVGGTIRKRADGRYEGRFRVAGRRHSVFAATQAEAQAKLRAAQSAADHGVKPIPQRQTVAAYLSEWLDGPVEQRCRARTVESYRATVARYIVPSLGSVPLAKLERRDVDAMLARLAAQRPALSPTTQRYALTVLRIALTRAVKEGKALRNVAALADAPKARKAEMVPLTAEQAQAFITSVVDDPLGPLFKLAIRTGLRQGELLALRWEDVDFDAGKLTVAHTLTEGSRTLAEPKTEKSKRTLVLGAGAVAALREQHRRQLSDRIAAARKWRDQGYVFTSGVGSPLDGRNVTHRFQAAVAAAGLPRQRFHDLRHAFATLMIGAGVDLYVVSRSLGHATIATTANTYAHLTPAMGEVAAARMDAILGHG